MVVLSLQAQKPVLLVQAVQFERSAIHPYLLLQAQEYLRQAVHLSAARPVCPWPADIPVLMHCPALWSLKLRMSPFSGLDQFVQRIDIRAGRSNNNISIRPLTVNNTASLFKTNGDISLSIGTAGNIIN